MCCNCCLLCSVTIFVARASSSEPPCGTALPYGRCHRSQARLSVARLPAAGRIHRATSCRKAMQRPCCAVRRQQHVQRPKRHLLSLAFYFWPSIICSYLSAYMRMALNSPRATAFCPRSELMYFSSSLLERNAVSKRIFGMEAPTST